MPRGGASGPRGPYKKPPESSISRAALRARRRRAAAAADSEEWDRAAEVVQQVWPATAPAAVARQWKGQEAALGECSLRKTCALPLARVESAEVAAASRPTLLALLAARAAMFDGGVDAAGWKGQGAVGSKAHGLPVPRTPEGWHQFVRDHGTFCNGGTWGINCLRRFGVGGKVQTAEVQAIPPTLAAYVEACCQDLEWLVINAIGKDGRDELERAMDLEPEAWVHGVGYVTGAWFAFGKTVVHADNNDQRGGLTYVAPLGEKTGQMIVHPAAVLPAIAKSASRLHRKGNDPSGTKRRCCGHVCPWPLATEPYGAGAVCWGTFSSLPHGSPVPPGEQDATRLAMTLYCDHRFSSAYVNDDEDEEEQERKQRYFVEAEARCDAALAAFTSKEGGGAALVTTAATAVESEEVQVQQQPPCGWTFNNDDYDWFPEQGVMSPPSSRPKSSRLKRRRLSAIIPQRGSAAAASTAASLVGRQVRKQFGARWFHGYVVEFDHTDGYWLVIYGDGDTEEYTTDELRVILQPIATKVASLCDKSISPSEKEEKVCSICLDPLDSDCCTTPCGHQFHRGCITHWFQHSPTGNTCPLCKAYVAVRRIETN